MSECIALAQELSSEESEKLLAVPDTIFCAQFANSFFIRQDYADVVKILAENLASDKPSRRVLSSEVLELGAFVSVGYKREKRRCLPSDESWVQLLLHLEWN